MNKITVRSLDYLMYILHNGTKNIVRNIVMSFSEKTDD